MADEKSSVEDKPVSEEHKEAAEATPKKPAEEPHEKQTEEHKHEQKKKEPAQKNIKPEAFRRFLKHLLLVSKKQKVRAKARAALQQHVEKLKEKPIAKMSDKKKFRKGLKGIDEKIDAVLEAERKLINIEKEDIDLVKSLKEEIIDLKNKLRSSESEKTKHSVHNKRNVEDLSSQLAEAKGKLEGYTKKRIDREEKIQVLMEKIKSTPVKKHEVHAAKKQLESLERKFKQLSRTSYGRERLDQLKGRINELKQKLIVEV